MKPNYDNDHCRLIEQSIVSSYLATHVVIASRRCVRYRTSLIVEVLSRRWSSIPHYYCAILRRRCLSTVAS